MARFQNDYIVCVCNNVSLGEIAYSIQCGAKTIEDISSKTDAGISCKCCISKANDTNEYTNKKDKRLYLDDILKFQSKQNKKQIIKDIIELLSFSNQENSYKPDTLELLEIDDLQDIYETLKNKKDEYNTTTRSVVDDIFDKCS